MQFVTEVLTGEQAPPKTQYPELQTVHTLTEEHVLQLDEHALHAPVLIKNPELHVVQVMLNPDFRQAEQLGMLHLMH